MSASTSRGAGAPPIPLDDVSWVCHQVRRPLSAILAFADILADGLPGHLNAEQADHVATIRRNAESLGTFVDELWELAASRQDARPGSDVVALGPACERARDAVHGAFASAGVRLDLDLRAEVVHGAADGERVERMLRRVLLAALSESEAGGEVALVLERDGGSARLVVTDRGARHRDVERAFLPFLPGRVGAPGLGLGPCLARADAIALGGEIRLEPLPGGGADWIVELPLPDGELGWTQAERPGEPQGNRVSEGVGQR